MWNLVIKTDGTNMRRRKPTTGSERWDLSHLGQTFVNCNLFVKMFPM